MKILVLCDHGNNRSVVIAHHLKYWGHDVLPAGLTANTVQTLSMLYLWADRVIFVERGPYQDALDMMPEVMEVKAELWDVGPDTYPRPFNPELLQKVRRLMEEHKSEYKL